MAIYAAVPCLMYLAVFLGSSNRYKEIDSEIIKNYTVYVAKK